MHTYGCSPPGERNLPLNWINRKALTTVVVILLASFVAPILTTKGIIPPIKPLIFGSMFVSGALMLSLIFLALAIAQFKSGYGIPLIGARIFDIAENIRKKEEPKKMLKKGRREDPKTKLRQEMAIKKALLKTLQNQAIVKKQIYGSVDPATTTQISLIEFEITRLHEKLKK